jgi:septum formation protein
MKEISGILKDYPFRIILGSASPRRQELLKGLGFSFEVRPVAADEDQWPRHLTAHEIPSWLAEHKSECFPGQLGKDDLLITADTIVWCEGKVLNKPADFDEACAMLESLSGRMHEVFTAVCLRSANKKRAFYDASRVYFKKLGRQEIEYYVKNYHPFDKAGGYGVQDWIGYIAIDRIEGSFYNVMGLPVRVLFEDLVTFAEE